MQAFARPLLRLYPDYWRSRYGDEFSALLDAYPMRLTTILDVLLGALDAHIHPQDMTGRILQMINRSRRTAIMVFCAYIAFVLAGLDFYKSTEDDIRFLMRGHTDITAAYRLVQGGAGLALAAVLAGGIPVALAALRWAWTQRRWDIPLLFAVPPVALAVWVAWTIIIGLVFMPTNANATPGHQMAGALFFSWAGVFVLAAIASTAAVSIAVSRSTLPPRLFRLALWPAAVATAFMAVILGAVIFWGLAVQTDVPTYFSTPTSPLRFDYQLAWIADIVVMGLATLVSVVALARAMRGPHEPQLARTSAGAA